MAWILVTRLETLYLFPLAFGILLLSRAALIVRGAALPVLVPPGKSLVEANASLSRISAISGMLVGIPGIALIKWPGVETELLVAAVVYSLGVIPAFRLPTVTGRIEEHERAGAKAKARAIPVRQALVAISGMRFLVGFLVFHLAFALRRDDFGTVGLGLLVGASALGALVGALAAPRLRRGLKEEGILVSCLALAGITSFAVGVWFTPFMAGVLVFVFGVASGASKVAFDAIVQRETPEGGRGWAFARYESLLQLAWVAGSLIPLLVAISAGAGAVAVGVAANVVGILFMIGRHRYRGEVLARE